MQPISPPENMTRSFEHGLFTHTCLRAEGESIALVQSVHARTCINCLIPHRRWGVKGLALFKARGAVNYKRNYRSGFGATVRGQEEGKRSYPPPSPPGGRSRRGGDQADEAAPRPTPAARSFDDNLPPLPPPTPVPGVLGRWHPRLRVGTSPRTPPPLEPTTPAGWHKPENTTALGAHCARGSAQARERHRPWSPLRPRVGSSPENDTALGLATPVGWPCGAALLTDPAILQRLSSLSAVRVQLAAWPGGESSLDSEQFATSLCLCLGTLGPPPTGATRYSR
jgi:hypothetical protein